jgi:hypothetical protein
LPLTLFPQHRLVGSLPLLRWLPYVLLRRRLLPILSLFLLFILQLLQLLDLLQLL